MLISYILFYYKFNVNKIYESYIKSLNKFKNNKLKDLLNGSGINNIPLLNIFSNNKDVTTANNCGKGPVFIGTSEGLNNTDCIRFCINDKAKIFSVNKDDFTSFNETILGPGKYCTINERPQCNMKTSRAIMTINSVQCSPKFPKLFGGNLGTNIVACNNLELYDPKNILWDYKLNEPVNSWTTTVLDEDEILENGDFRFRCKYDGLDSRNNKFIENPLNRFHPTKNYCANLLYGAHPNVKTIFYYDQNQKLQYKCDCGDYNETRVKNIYPNDITSQCSNISFETKQNYRKMKTATIPYKCFNIFSPAEDVAKYPPCPTEKFTINGSQVAPLTIDYTNDMNALIEHPLYSLGKISEDGVYLRVDEKINE